MSDYTQIQYEPVKKAVIYARFSSAAQNEQSIEGQLTVCHEYAERNGYQIVNEYIDRAISGRSDDRPDFQRMIEDSKSGAFQYVLVYKLDRFARNRYDSAIYKVQLKKNGVKVISCMENIGDNPESIILEAVLEASAEYYSIDLAQKIKRGMIESAKKGYYLSSRPPIGYKKQDRRLVADPDISPHVRWAFEAYADGMSRKDILKELNRRGLRTTAGKPLVGSSLQKMFGNEKYLGILDQQGFRIEDAHEAIIDRDLFDKVQEKLKVNRRSGAHNKADNPYILSGKLYCGHCGALMHGVSGTGKSGNAWYYYSCGNRRRQGVQKCTKKHEKKDFIEWYVVEQTLQYVLRPDMIKRIARAVVAEYEKSFDDSQIKEVEKRLERIRSKVTKIVDMLIDVPKEGRQPLYDKLEALGTERSDLEIELAKLQIARKTPFTEEMITKWLKQFCAGDAMDLAFRQKIIDVLISRVYLFDDKVIIYYNIDSGKQISFIDMLEDAGEAPSPDEDLPEEKEGSYIEPSSGAEGLKYEPFRFVIRRGALGLVVYRD